MIRMKKKKLVGILVAFCLSASLITACGGGNDNLTESSSETETQTTASSKDKKDDSKTNESETQKEAAETDKDETNSKDNNGKETDKTTETQKTNSNNGSSGNTTSTKNSSGNSSSASTPKTSGSSSSQNKSNSSGNSSNSGSSSSGSSGSSSSSGSTSQPSVHTHNFKVVSETAATCTTDGVRTYQCSCGQTKTETIAPALGHNWVKKTHTETIPAQTHTEYAWKSVCNGCGKQFDTPDEALNHIMSQPFDSDCQSYSEKQVAVGTVTDVPASTVEVTDYVYCSRCNARQ